DPRGGVTGPGLHAFGNGLRRVELDERPSVEVRECSPLGCIGDDDELITAIPAALGCLNSDLQALLDELGRHKTGQIEAGPDRSCRREQLVHRCEIHRPPPETLSVSSTGRAVWT